MPLQVQNFRNALNFIESVFGVLGRIAAAFLTTLRILQHEVINKNFMITITCVNIRECLGVEGGCIVLKHSRLGTRHNHKCKYKIMKEMYVFSLKNS